MYDNHNLFSFRRGILISIQKFISCSIPTYQAEMSIEISERGPEVAVTCVFLVSGAAIAYWIDFGFTRMENQISWVRSLPSPIFTINS